MASRSPPRAAGDANGHRPSSRCVLEHWKGRRGGRMHMALELPATRARRSPHNPTQNGAGSGARARYSALSMRHGRRCVWMAGKSLRGRTAGGDMCMVRDICGTGWGRGRRGGGAPGEAGSSWIAVRLRRRRRRQRGDGGGRRDTSWGLGGRSPPGEASVRRGMGAGRDRHQRRRMGESEDEPEGVDGGCRWRPSLGTLAGDPDAGSAGEAHCSMRAAGVGARAGAFRSRWAAGDRARCGARSGCRRRRGARSGVPADRGSRRRFEMEGGSRSASPACSSRPRTLPSRRPASEQPSPRSPGAAGRACAARWATAGGGSAAESAPGARGRLVGSPSAESQPRCGRGASTQPSLGVFPRVFDGFWRAPSNCSETTARDSQEAL